MPRSITRRLSAVLAAALALMGCGGGVELQHVVSLSPDGRLLMERGDQLQLFDLTSRKPAWRVTLSRPASWHVAREIAWSQDGAFFVLPDTVTCNGMTAR